MRTFRSIFLRPLSLYTARGFRMELFSFIVPVEFPEAFRCDLHKALRAARVGVSINVGFLHQLKHFEKSGTNKQGRNFLTAEFGEWPAERAALDVLELNRLIAIPEEFIPTGYDIDDARAPEDANDQPGGDGGDAGTRPKPTYDVERLL